MIDLIVNGLVQLFSVGDDLQHYGGSGRSDFSRYLYAPQASSTCQHDLCFFDFSGRHVALRIFCALRKNSCDYDVFSNFKSDVVVYYCPVCLEQRNYSLAKNSSAAQIDQEECQWLKSFWSSCL